MMDKKIIDSSIDTINSFFEEFPDSYSKENTSPASPAEKQVIKDSITRDLNKKIAPNDPTTAPDELTSFILELLYEHDEADRKKIREQYINQKQAEMMIGKLLEMYILSKGFDLGWCFAGSCIKSVDFIKNTPDGWQTLQIKNSDNTENSSSSSVRQGTTIMKWARRKSKTGETYWDKFPDTELRKMLSEKDFKDFISSYFSDK